MHLLIYLRFRLFQLTLIIRVLSPPSLIKHGMNIVHFILLITVFKEHFLTLRFEEQVEGCLG